MNNEILPDEKVERAMVWFGKISVGCGIIGIILDVIIVGVLFGVLGLIFGGWSVSNSKNKALGIIGIVLSSICIIIFIVIIGLAYAE